MEEFTAVTTFSAPGYRLYGRRFVESFLRYWPIPLIAYYETERPAIVHPRLTLRDLGLDEDRAAFLSRYDAPPYRGTPADYATQAIRFCHKVFAVTSDIPPTTWWIWIDADVETFAPVTPAILQTMCPAGSSLSYLGRQTGMNSETGFVAYRVEDPCVRAMMSSLRHMYRSGRLFALDPRERHDGALFDRARSAIPEERLCNLSRDVAGTHVWPSTVLGSVMRHWKGRGRKKEGYGGTVA